MEKKEISTRPPEPVRFHENCCYTVEQVSEIIHRHPKTIRQMCKRGVIAARCDRGGFMITGWALRAYLECRSVICQ